MTTMYKLHTCKVDKKLQNAQEQAGAELGQAQLPTMIWLYCD